MQELFRYKVKGDFELLLERILNIYALSCYYLVDGASDPSIFERVVQSGFDYEPLFSGDPFDSNPGVAPLLFRLQPGGEELKKWVVEMNRTTGSGVVFASDFSDLKRMRRLLKKQIQVLNHNGKLINFRFYDPYALTDVLAVMTATQTAEFFEALELVCFMDADGDNILYKEKAKYDTIV